MHTLGATPGIKFVDSPHGAFNVGKTCIIENKKICNQVSLRCVCEIENKRFVMRNAISIVLYSTRKATVGLQTFV